MGIALLSAALIATSAVGMMPSVSRATVDREISNASTVSTQTVKKSPVDGNYYFADYDTAQEAFDAGDKANKAILSEGVTLLKNENSLPLKAGAKVSVFGNRSANDLRYGGAGSGAGSGGSKITLQRSRRSYKRYGVGLR